MMKKTIQLFKKTWFLSLLGIFLLSFLIYFFVPKILPLGEENEILMIRIIGISVVIILWLVFLLWTLYRENKQNDKMIDRIDPKKSKSVDPKGADTELSKLDKKLSDALNKLKNERFSNEKGEAKLFSQLPWYIIIGPPDSGKTTLLRNSSLKMPKFGREAIPGGSTGTKNCDWWFTEEAILLDTAGRYTTQDSNKKVDNKAWLGFLELLQNSRTRRPLNGIIVAISIKELLSSKKSRERHILNIRDRLLELNEQLNLRLPVYITFTKVDLIAGFSVFFQSLSEKEREVVWGVSFTKKNKPISNPIKLLQEELDHLERKLRDKTLSKLEKEIDLENRKKIHAFPEEFSLIKHSIHQFVTKIFSEKHSKNKIFLRGVYFTSAEQTGSPIATLASKLSQIIGFDDDRLRKENTKGRSFFINDLLHKVIFPEAELAGLNSAYVKKRRMTLWAIYGGAAIITTIGLALLYNSYIRNKGVITDLKEGYTELQDLQASTNDTENINDIVKILNQAEKFKVLNEGWIEDFGLNERTHTLSIISRKKYKEALKAKLRPLVLSMLEARLSDDVKNKEVEMVIFDSLRNYLIFFPCNDACAGSNSNSHSLIYSVSKMLCEKKQCNNKTNEKLANHLKNLLKHNLSVKEENFNNDLIKKARTYLKNTDRDASYNKLAYYFLIDRVDNYRKNIKDDSKKIKIDSYEYILGGYKNHIAIDNNIFVKQVKIPSRYTRESFNTLIDNRKKIDAILDDFKSEIWILDTSEGDKKAINTDNVLDYYREVYYEYWKTALFSLKIKPMTTIDELIEILDKVTSEDSPILSIIEEVVTETNLSENTSSDTLTAVKDTATKSAIRFAERKARGIKLNKKGKSSSKKRNSDEDNSNYAYIENLKKFSDGNSSSYKELITGMRSLKVSLVAFKDETEPAKKHTKKEEASTTIEKLLKISEKQISPINNWATDILTSINNFLTDKDSGIIKKITGDINAQWNKNVCNKFSQIKGKYPLNGGLYADAKLGDFSNFFNSISMYTSNLNPETADNITGKAKEQIKRAGRIKAAFFPESSLNEPTMRFYLTLSLPVDDIIEEISFKLGETELLYKNGKTNKSENKMFLWSGNSSTFNVEITHTPQYAYLNINKNYSSWDLIKKFQPIKNLDDYAFSLSDVTFLLETNQTNNILNFFYHTGKKDLKNFQCPKNLVDGVN